MQCFCACQDGTERRSELSTCSSFSFLEKNKRSLNTRNFSYCLSTFPATALSAVAIRNAFVPIPHSLKSGYELNNSIYHLRKLTFITITRTKLFNNSWKNLSKFFTLFSLLLDGRKREDERPWLVGELFLPCPECLIHVWIRKIISTADFCLFYSLGPGLRVFRVRTFAKGHFPVGHALMPYKFEASQLCSFNFK